MNPQLSRRAAQARQYPPLSKLPYSEIIRFGNAVDRVDSFDELPEKWRILIWESEAAADAEDRRP